MHHSDFISILSSIKKPNIYLELGLYTGETMSKVVKFCNKAYGVDMQSNTYLNELQNNNIEKLNIYYETTDQFFEHFDEKIDMAFIDADHAYNSVLKDFNNILKLLSDDGIIFIHDTDPENNMLFSKGYCGDSYKIVPLFENRDDINIITLPMTEAGLSIVMKKNSSRTYIRNKKNKIGWLVNDTLTCIPNTITFWHNLLDWFPYLEDKTNGYTDFSILPSTIENDFTLSNNKPYYIIRNGTYFRPLNVDAKTIVLIQDIHYGDLFNQQIETINKADIVIFNSNYVYNKYSSFMKHNRYKIIPLGVNFDMFKPSQNKYPGILPNSILYIGNSSIYPKGFDRVLKIVEQMPNQNFCFIMKDDYTINHPRIKIFNKISQKDVSDIINSCICTICTSREETQHLSGIQSGACNVPIVATSVGVYDDIKNSTEWGLIADETNFVEKINYVINNIDDFNPRKFFLDKGYSIDTCRESWKIMIENL
jgi:glycosyltransferase involved in cell wall biosynthesis